jgi:hypothetical protein
MNSSMLSGQNSVFKEVMSEVKYKEQKLPTFIYLNNIQPKNDEDEMIKKIQWPEFMSELYQSSDHRLSAKLVPTFADISKNNYSSHEYDITFNVP